MSFILDALRKSENERREQAPPALAAAPQAAATKKGTLWLPILAIALAINAIVFGAIVLTRDEPAPVAAPALPPAETEVRSLRMETFADAAPVTQIEPPVLSPKTPSTTPVPTRSAAPESVPAPSGRIQEGLPNLGQLRAAGLVSVANLHVDMHVYAGDAAKRFVFVNMKKYREGDRLSEGPTIEEITPDGIIMVQQGNRFRLDRD